MQSAAAETNRQRKMRLFKEAIALTEQVTATHRDVTPQSAERKSRMMAEVQFISLQDLARARLSLTSLVPQQVDPVMAREIILALLAPGESGRRFTAAYRAEDTLRVRVRKQFEVHLDKQFDPKKFRETLSWLVNDDVFFTKPKTDEKVYALTSKTRGKSAEAQAVIRAILDFDRNLREM